MKSLLFVAVFFTSFAVEAACQARLVMLSEGVEVVHSNALNTEQTEARAAFERAISAIIQATGEAGIELVEGDSSTLTLDLSAVRRNDKVKGTRMDLKVAMNSSIGMLSMNFSQESGLPLFAGRKALGKEYDKRLKEAVRNIRALPGCR